MPNPTLSRVNFVRFEEAVVNLVGNARVDVERFFEVREDSGFRLGEIGVVKSRYHYLSQAEMQKPLFEPCRPVVR
jgi:hypothetical protein